ncbi:hypothetical protein [Solirubrobacter soli]|uniref:hypothetical protein n=1 Tax=Solirubrobacter soli TaxID=363832 RepID=UPI000482EB6D|nr:hypothetical protein [Solirubrobacter soli]
MNVIAPPNGAGVPITVACGPPTSVVPFSGVATSAQLSAPVTATSPEDVLTIALEFAPEALYPVCPPNATLTVIGAPVVLRNVSSHRDQLACPAGTSFLT